MEVNDKTAPVFYDVPKNYTTECDDIEDPANVTAVDECEEVFVELDETREPEVFI